MQSLTITFDGMHKFNGPLIINNISHIFTQSTDFDSFTIPKIKQYKSTYSMQLT